jgi:hypothetical protein
MLRKLITVEKLAQKSRINDDLKAIEPDSKPSFNWEVNDSKM